MRWIDRECWAAGCKAPTTHILKSRIMDSGIPPFEQEVGYCEADAQHFAWWLIFTYTGEFEILDVRPTTSEDFYDETV